MRYLALAAIMFSIAGCHASSTYSIAMLPDGSNGAVLTCRYRAECFSIAGRACAGAYSVLQAEDNNPHVVDPNGEHSYLVPASDFNPSTRGTEFVIRCNPHRGDGS